MAGEFEPLSPDDDEADLADLLAPLTTGPGRPMAPASVRHVVPASPMIPIPIPSVVVVVAGNGAGRRFHPVPGTPLAVPAPAPAPDPARAPDPAPVSSPTPASALGDSAPGAAARMIASAGSSIHALEAGRVTRLDSGRVRLLTESGLLVDYFGVDGAAAEPGGRDVPAGAVVGALIPTGGPAGLGELVLRIQDGAGVLLDAADLLVGSTDPAELGVSPAGAGPAGNGLGLDPEQLDRELVEPRETTT